MTIEQQARRVRARLVTMSHRTGAPHLGSALSCVDLLLAAYHQLIRLDKLAAGDDDRDRLILSKGHAAAALYAVLHELGLLPAEALAGYAQPGSPLGEQMSPGCAAGVEAATGSLGHGLPIGLGMALAGRQRGWRFETVVVLSDGECNEGSVWEAAMMAAARRVERLTVIVDFNGWQATGRSREVMALDPLPAKWEAFGWETREVDGHDVGALAASLAQRTAGPRAIIAHTVKGKGVSFMEDDNNWHYRVPNAAEVEAALAELGIPCETHSPNNSKH